MLPRKIFESLDAAMRLFQRFLNNYSGKFCLKFLTLILIASPNMTHFVRTFSIVRAEGVKDLSLANRFEIMEKLLTSKAFLKVAGGNLHTSHPTPLDPPLAMSYRNHQKSLAYFSHLAPLILFFFTKQQSQKGGLLLNATPLNTLLLATPKRARIAH